MWAAIQAIAQLAGAAASVNNSLTGSTVSEQNTAQPGGQAVTPMNFMDTQQPGPVQEQPGMDLGAIIQAALSSASGTQRASQVQASTPGLEAPGGEENKAKEATDKQPEQPEIGDILAAIPDAMAALDLLFSQPQNQRSTRPAPVAGAPGGQVVGQFARPLGQPQLNIGQLLAALPRI